MTHPTGAVAIPLMLVVAGLSVLARRFRVPSPILMLVAGTAIAFVPWLPPFAIDPALVLLWLLPPLLYSSGVGMSWRGFRSYLRPIMMLAVGCVLFTASGVALVAHWILGLPWAVGFVLGAIVSPPDAVAPIAILRSLRLPRGLVTVLEGESLVNDATALVTLSFATAAVVTGTFSLASATIEFAIILFGEIAFGIAVGWMMLRVRSLAADARAEVLLALATPYVAFWPAHAVGGSGVIACVTAGLYVSWNGRRLIRPDTRLQGYFIWDLVVWATEAVIFFLAGLQARSVFAGLSEGLWSHALAAASLVTITVIVVRFLWVYPATSLPYRLFRRLAHASGPPGDWRMPLVVAFCGLRGAVSLLAALLVPATIAGAPFPHRDLVLFSTYCVVVFTLIGFGGALPWVVRKLGVDRMGADEAADHDREERVARLDGIAAMLKAVSDDQHPLVPMTNSTRERVTHHLELRSTVMKYRLEGQVTEDIDDAALQLRLLAIERDTITVAYEANRITDESRRRIERELDLEEAHLRQRGSG